jgi:AraC-like DNA-binding protein
MTKLKAIGHIPAPVLAIGAHGHDSWEVVCYTHGRGVITVGDQPVPFSPGTIVCLPPIIPHHELSEAGYRNYYLLIDRLPFREVTSFVDDDERSFTGLAALLHREWYLQRPHAQAMIDALFAAMQVLFQRWHVHKPAHRLLEQLDQLIVAGLCDPEFDLASAMRKLPATPHHIRRLFRAERGISPLEHLEDLRVREAKRLLALDGFSVKEVAARVGFRDPYYFSRVFRRRAGCSPSAFAERRP